MVSFLGRFLVRRKEEDLHIGVIGFANKREIASEAPIAKVTFDSPYNVKRLIEGAL
jgi:hypothetical protein